MNRILHNKPCVGKEELAALQKVLEKDWLIAGGEVEKFEHALKSTVGVSYALATNSGTAALHLSLLTLGVGKHDEVIIPSYTSSDLLNAISYCEADPVLVDIKKGTCIIDTQKIGDRITSRTKAMIIPHTFGFPVDIPDLYKYKLPIIEDCAQAIGSFFENKPVGSMGDISVFSFFATKLLTTGQGGMVLTNNKRYYENMRDLINYNGRDTYRVRYNYPLTDIAASIGNVQLQKYPVFSKKRKQIAQRYQNLLERKDILHFPQKTDNSIIPFRFLFLCKSTALLEKIKQAFWEEGIEVKQPIAPYELLHRLLKKDPKQFINTEDLAKKALSLPLYPCLTEEGIEKICQAVEKIL